MFPHGMQGFTWVLTGILSFLMGLWLWKEHSRKKLPPGPLGLPIVGYLPFLRSRPYVKLLELKKKYGPVFTVQFGYYNVVILADYKTIKEAFLKDTFFGRPESILELNNETKRLGAFEKLPWKEQRRFALQAFRDLGLSKPVMEMNVTEEIQDLLEQIAQFKGKPITIVDFLAPSVSNIITALVFGQRRKFDDPKRIYLDELVNRVMKAAEGVAWVTFFPFLKSLVKLLPFANQRMLKQAFSDFKSFVRDEMKEHKKTFDPNDVKDFMDKYLIEIEKRKGNPTTTFNEAVLEDVIQLFFGGGSETVRTALDWLLLVSAAFPDVQGRIKAEIDDVVGAKFPTKSDQPHMPYTGAVIQEVLRWRTIIPINLPRCTLEDTTLDSYTIPKHTQVFAVIWAVHQDPDLWGDDVDSFRPERFLSEDGKELRIPEYFIPFSTGKRVCPGESLAQMEMFMYYTAILQKFTVRLPEGTKPDLDYTDGFSLRPKPYKLQFIVRS